MTNHYIDLKNTDCALIIGSNAAENHPMSFKWLTKAREERGARIISVDPRFTRTSAKADIYAPIRSGTDIAFIGGMINYILRNRMFNEAYVRKYTNAAFIIDDRYDFKDGIFSGYDSKSRKYSTDTWKYKTDSAGQPLKDETLQHPRTVFQLLKKHYSRYDIDTVCRITGTPKGVYMEIADTYAATGARGKAGTILYAMGATQHTVGSQNIRSYAMLQLLLGNIGVPGGGINALRGEANVQGSTDMALLFHLIPGYLNLPTAAPQYATLASYLETETPKTGYWSNKPKFMVSLLKAFWGPNATKDNEFAYQYLPKIDPQVNYSHISVFEALYEEKIKGMFCFGQNPVVGGPNANKEAKALGNLDWLVCVDLWETETSTFWTEKAGARPADIKTEVFLLPAASSVEKEGTVSNSGRWIQWRWKAIEPVNDAKSDGWIINSLFKRVKKLYENESSPAAAPIKHLLWDYGDSDEPDIDKVAREINGYNVFTGKQVPGFAKLSDDGSTCSGNWVFCGMYPEEGKNLSQRRDNTDEGGLGNCLNWSYSWPANRRILYNRCSADYAGRPWSDDSKLIWWDPAKGDILKGEKGKWVGLDVPDFNAVLAPAEPGGTNPFIMLPETVGGLFTTKMKEGPFPEHYEPWESPVNNSLSGVQLNPVVKVPKTPMNEQGSPDRFPIIGTTYRVSEHWQAGQMTRNLPWLAELFPDMFVEMSESLAKARGIKNGDKVVISCARGEITTYALVTKRFKPLLINGKQVEEVGLPWHFGYQGIATGEIANKLTPHIGDGNTMIPEYKAFLVDVRRTV